MELKILIKIFIKYKKLFWSIMIVFIVIGCIYYVSQPKKFSVATTLHITRSISENYKKSLNFGNDFSSFYRLQADEKIADSIVAWLKSPSIVLDILKTSGQNLSEYNNNDDLVSIYNVNKASSQIVNIKFMTNNKLDGKKQVDSIDKKLNELLKAMIIEKSTSSWFKVIVEEPVIYFYEKSLIFTLSLSLALGFFTSFVIIILIHYIKEEN